MHEINIKMEEAKLVVAYTQVDERVLHIVQHRNPVDGRLHIEVRHRATMDDGSARELFPAEITELLENVLNSVTAQSGKNIQH